MRGKRTFDEIKYILIRNQVLTCIIMKNMNKQKQTLHCIILTYIQRFRYFAGEVFGCL